MPADKSIMSGIYAIRCIPTGKIYVGSAVNLLNRWSVHRMSFRTGNHASPRLFNAWKKYGEDQFTWEVLEYVDDTSTLIEREQHYIDLFKAADERFGLNVSPIAGSSLGRKSKEETKAKQSAASQGKKHSAETRAKMSEIAKNSPKVREQVAKLHAPEMRAKNTESRRNSPKVRAQIAMLQTPEIRAKSIEGIRNSPKAREHLAKLHDLKRERDARRKGPAKNQGKLFD